VEKLLNVEEVARVLGVSVHTVYTWVSCGRLPLVKVGARTMFEPVEIRRWVAERSRREAGGAGSAPPRSQVPRAPAGGVGSPGNGRVPEGA
jgi:excisionase family DNA binding protein